MLTDKEAERIRSEYDALPGTPPDGFNSRKATDDPQENRRLFIEMIEESRSSGMGHCRATIDEAFGYLWVESWKTRPEKEAPFDPQYTASPSTG